MAEVKGESTLHIQLQGKQSFYENLQANVGPVLLHGQKGIRLMDSVILASNNIVLTSNNTILASSGYPI